MTWNVTRYDRFDQLPALLLEQWCQLDCPSPMQRCTWLRRWWQSFGDPSCDELCLVGVWDGERLIGLAPWYTAASRTYDRVLRFLGDGITCSDHATILTRSGFAPRVRRCLANWLDEHAGSVWDRIAFEAIDSGTCAEQVVADLARLGHNTHTRDAVGCWEVSLPTTWDDYLRSLSKNHRKRCRRWQRAYFDTGRAEVIDVSLHAVQASWHQLVQLNLERRTQVGDRSAFADPRFVAFHQGTLPCLLRAGNARLQLLQLDGKIVAAEYVLLQDDTVYCYQSGMAASSGSDGYGNLSILALFRFAVDQGYRKLDFLRGDECYKAHWGARRRHCRNHQVALNTLTGTAHVACHRAVDWVRTLLPTLREGRA